MTMASKVKIGMLKNLTTFLRQKKFCSLPKAFTNFSVKQEHVQPKNILYSAICVERLPIIAPQKSELEKDFVALQHDLEREKSLLSDHEVQRIKESLMDKEETEEMLQDDDGKTKILTTLDLEDAWESEWSNFKPGSPVTPADEANDTKSLDRKLDSSLYLLVRQDIEGRPHWVFPQATWRDGETMRETAERALHSVCGDVKARVLGNAPSAVAKYAPKDPSKVSGIKLFFYKAWFESGEVVPNTDKATDYVWVTKEEMQDYCHNGYRRHVKSLLL